MPSGVCTKQLVGRIFVATTRHYLGVESRGSLNMPLKAGLRSKSAPFEQEEAVSLPEGQATSSLRMTRMQPKYMTKSTSFYFYI